MPNSAPTDSGLLSVVLPAFNEEEMAPRAADVISALLEQAQIPHELIFVDDGSRDRTWARIQEKSRALPQVRGVRFSRNFGKEAAIFAGLAQAQWRLARVVLDCDLQHPPEKIVDMYRLWQQGYQVVEGVKVSRGKESPLHTLAVQVFLPGHRAASTGLDMSRASDFKLLDRRAVDVLLAMREKNAFFRALSSWIGFSTAQVEFQVREREAGRVQVVYPFPGALRHYQPGRLLHRAPADRHLPGRTGVFVLPGAGRLVPVAEDQRTGPGGLYHGHSAPAAHWKHSDDLPGHHRLLHRQDLRGDQGPAPVHYPLRELRRQAG